jgi:hypothetical protein
MIGSKTSVAKYASGWVASHPGETRCEWERVFRTHGEAVEFATNHALACLHTLERRREENRRLIAQAADIPDYMLGPSAHRDVIGMRLSSNGEIAEEISWSEIVQPNGPIRYDAPDIGTRLRNAAIERLRNARLSVVR